MLDKNIIPESTSEVCVRGPTQLVQLKFGGWGTENLNIFCACDGPPFCFGVASNRIKGVGRHF